MRLPASFLKDFLVVAAVTILGAARLCQAADDAYARQMQQIGDWFAAWELVSRDVYGIDRLRPVEFVFFDAERVYTTSAVSGRDGDVVEGPDLLDTRPVWRTKQHEGVLLLPDGQGVPIGLMSFAAPAGQQAAGAFFVMPLPDFWESAGVSSEEFGLARLLTGVFLHEFSHSQQMQSFGARISWYEDNYSFDGELNDDIVQNSFEKDTGYVSAFREETALFYAAAHSGDADERKALARSALDRYATRQKRYFTGDKALFAELDDFFLSMEGIGQFSMYAWLVHPGGGKLDKAVAEKGARRGGRWWSQEEGLALFMALQRFSDPADWSEAMFGDEPGDVVELLESALASSR